MSFVHKTTELASDVPGLTSNAILGFLYDVVTWKRPVHVIEIGPWMGRTSVAIAQALEALGGYRRLTSVDMFTQRYGARYLDRPTMRYALRRCGPEIETLYRDFARLPTIEDCFNLTRQRHPELACRSALIKSLIVNVDLSTLPMSGVVFVDADSTWNGTRMCLLKTLPRMNAGAALVIDGYRTERFSGLDDFVDEILDSGAVCKIGQVDGDVAIEITDPAGLLDYVHVMPVRMTEDVISRFVAVAT